MRTLAIVAASGLALAMPLAQADDPVWPVRPEPGLTCMTTITASSILEQPVSDAVVLAVAGPVVFAVQPRQIANGYIEVVRPNRQIGWIRQDLLSAGPAKCAPTLMSNGLILMGNNRG